MIVAASTAACGPVVPVEFSRDDAGIDGGQADAAADGGPAPVDSGPSPAHPDWPAYWTSPALPARGTIVAVLFRSASAPVELVEVGFDESEPVRLEIPESVGIWTAGAGGAHLGVDSRHRVHLTTALRTDGGPSRYLRSYDLRTDEWVVADLGEVPFDTITVDAWELHPSILDDRFVLWRASRLELDSFEVLSVGFDGRILGSTFTSWWGYEIGPGGWAYANREHEYPRPSCVGVLDPATFAPIAECPRYVGPDEPHETPRGSLVDVDGTYVRTEERPSGDGTPPTWALQWRRLCTREVVHEVVLPVEDRCSRLLALARDHVAVLECDFPEGVGGQNRVIRAYGRDGSRFLFPRLQAAQFLAGATDRLEL